MIKLLNSDASKDFGFKVTQEQIDEYNRKRAEFMASEKLRQLEEFHAKFVLPFISVSINSGPPFLIGYNNKEKGTSNAK